jgi:hypothetical protein
MSKSLDLLKAVQLEFQEAVTANTHPKESYVFPSGRPVVRRGVINDSLTLNEIRYACTVMVNLSFDDILLKAHLAMGGIVIVQEAPTPEELLAKEESEEGLIEHVALLNENPEFAGSDILIAYNSALISAEVLLDTFPKAGGEFTGKSVSPAKGGRFGR